MNIYKKVQEIKKNPKLDDNKIFWALDLIVIRAENKIRPKQIEKIPIIVLDILPTSSASKLFAVLGKVKRVSFSGKIINNNPSNIMTIPLKFKIFLELLNISKNTFQFLNFEI